MTDGSAVNARILAVWRSALAVYLLGEYLDLGDGFACLMPALCRATQSESRLTDTILFCAGAGCKCNARRVAPGHWVARLGRFVLGADFYLPSATHLRILANETVQ